MPHEPDKEVWEKALKGLKDLGKDQELCKCGHHRDSHATIAGRCLAGPATEWCKCQKYDPEIALCECGHTLEQHDTGNVEGEECLACWEDSEKPLSTCCNGYKPMTKPEVSEKFEDVNKEALKQLGNGAVPKANNYYGDSYEYGNYGGYSGKQYGFKKCTHKPWEAFSGSGWSVWVGKKDDCIPELSKDEFGLILNCSNSGGVLPHHKIPVSWGKKYETLKAKEIELDWPDMSIPTIKSEFWRDLLHYIEEKKMKLLVFCIGGHGRTGTALAAIMIAGGWTAQDAKKWIWKNYCREAIESKAQEDYLDKLYEHYKPKKGAN